MATSKLIDITYVPADCGSVIFGKSKAPEAFQKVQLAEQLRSAGVLGSERTALDEPATWRSAKTPQGGVRNEGLNIEVCERVRDTLDANLEATAEQPAFQLILGGECCMLPGILSSFSHHYERSQKRVGLVYIDADTDLNAPTDPGSTGNLAAQTMTHLIGASGTLESMKQFHKSDGQPVLDATNTVLFGTNMAFEGNEREHFAYLFDQQYRVISSSSLAKDPVQRAKDALRYLDEQQVDVILVHLDVDAIDPREFPLANIPNYTGVDFETMMKALETLLGHRNAAALSVAEVNPDHDPGLAMTKQLSDRIVEMLLPS